MLEEIRAAADKNIRGPLGKSVLRRRDSIGEEAAFIVGGEYGKGVVSCRDGKDRSTVVLMLQKGSVGFRSAARPSTWCRWS